MVGGGDTFYPKFWVNRPPLERIKIYITSVMYPNIDTRRFFGEPIASVIPLVDVDMDAEAVVEDAWSTAGL